MTGEELLNQLQNVDIETLRKIKVRVLKFGRVIDDYYLIDSVYVNTEDGVLQIELGECLGGDPQIDR